METFEGIQEKREEIRKRSIACINAGLRREDAEEATETVLREMITECGVVGYLFTICITDLTTKFGKTIAEPLERIYRRFFDMKYKFLEDDEPCPERKLSFAAFYALMTLLVEARDTAETKRILTDPETAGSLNGYFYDFALYHDILSRYYKRAGGEFDLYQALEENNMALEHLKNEGVSNAGIYCSYASTVCKMCKQGITVRPRYAELAADCIRMALEFNPAYAKYHYIHSEIIYYRSRTVDGLKTKIDELNRAYEEADEAILREDLTRQDSADRVEEYRSFKLCLQMELDRLAADAEKERAPGLTREEISAWKANICASADEDHCKKPALVQNCEDYIFICYSRMDYKKVFCDLVELYARGVPFRYDKGGMTVQKGSDWEQSVRSKLLDSHCRGVIFYLGEYTLLSESLEQEEKAILEKAGDRDLCRVMFCVNTTKQKASHLLANTIRRHTQEELDRCHVDDERLLTFLRIFTDRRDFIARDPAPEDASHIDEVLTALRDNFGIKPRA